VVCTRPVHPWLMHTLRGAACRGGPAAIGVLALEARVITVPRQSTNAERASQADLCVRSGRALPMTGLSAPGARCADPKAGGQVTIPTPGTDVGDERPCRVMRLSPGEPLVDDWDKSLYTSRLIIYSGLTRPHCLIIGRFAISSRELRGGTAGD